MGVKHRLWLVAEIPSGVLIAGLGGALAFPNIRTRRADYQRGHLIINQRVLIRCITQMFNFGPALERRSESMIHCREPKEIKCGGLFPSRQTASSSGFVLFSHLVYL